MMTDSSSIFDAALGLSDDDRASLAYRLLQSLRPPGGSSDRDDEFERQLERRVADYDAGKADAADWDEVASRVREALERRDAP